MRWIRRIGVAAAAIAVLYLGGGSLAGALVTGWLLTPGNVDWSGATRPAPADPFALGYRGDPRQALGLDFATIQYQTALGEAEAWLVPAAAPSPLWAVYVHGIGGLRENGYRQLSILQEAGIPTLLITYRNDVGAPADPRPFFSFGLKEWPDLDAAIGWMLANGAERVVLVAESMGGAIAGQFLIHSQRAGAVSALALDAPALDVQWVLEAGVGQFGLPFAGLIGAGTVRVLDISAPAPVGTAVSMTEVARFAGPLFLAHGSADRLVPVAISDAVAQMRTGPTEYLRTAADHLLSFQEEPGRYREEMLAFLRRLVPG